MPKGIPVDRNNIHVTLWDRSDRLNKITLHQRNFAKEIGISYFAVCRILKELSEEGRIKKVAAKKDNVAVYAVRDPANF